MKRLPILQADVFIKNVGTPEQRQQLIDEAWSAYNNNDDNIGFSYRGCWRSYFNYSNLEWLVAEIKQTVNEAVSYYQQHDPIYKDKCRFFEDAHISYCTNINQIGSKIELHDHKLYQYVAVYYLQGTGTGDIIFSNPAMTEGCNSRAPFVGPYAVSPNDGDLFIWPAWLPHETETNRSDRHRINITFDIRFPVISKI
jgi:hypothetical protein